MRTLLAGLAAGAILLAVSFATPAPASDKLAQPTAASIEKLLRDMRAKGEPELPSMIPLKYAVLMEFGLVSLHQVSPSRWQAEIELLVEFGPPPPSILGFERMRRGRYWLVLNRQGERWGMSRFSPIARIHLLPARS